MKFCFFGNISNALKGKTVGGAELQIALLAKSLALNKQEVVIIDPESTESFVTKEGVRLLKVQDWNKGIRGFRLFMHRIPTLKKIFTEENADFYYVRMKSYRHLIPYWASKKTNGKFIIALAADLEVSGLMMNIKHKYKIDFNLYNFLTRDLPNELAYKFLLKRADYILTQHSGQALYLKKTRARILLFPNIFDFSNLPAIDSKTKDYFIIAGTLSVLKGVTNLKSLLSSLTKKITLVIVGQPVDKEAAEIYDQFKNEENVILKGRLSHNETIHLISQAKALINTSNFEGFPNIFLEAWATGVPVISLHVNPGNIFNHANLGTYCNGDLDTMKKTIELFDTVKTDKESLISYVSEVHNFSTAGRRFLNLLTTPKTI